MRNQPFETWFAGANHAAQKPGCTRLKPGAQARAGLHQQNVRAGHDRTFPWRNSMPCKSVDYLQSAVAGRVGLGQSGMQFECGHNRQAGPEVQYR